MMRIIFKRKYICFLLIIIKEFIWKIYNLTYSLNVTKTNYSITLPSVPFITQEKKLNVLEVNQWMRFKFCSNINHAFKHSFITWFDLFLIYLFTIIISSKINASIIVIIWKMSLDCNVNVVITFTRFAFWWHV